MPIAPIISFDAFVEIINDAISTNKNLSDDREYRIKVGEIAKEFKEAKWGKRSKDIDSKTKDWISDLSSQFGGSWTDVKNLSFQRIRDLSDGTARVIHAHAIHYRLHAELSLPQFARKIDEFVFGGETFEQSHKHPVFLEKTTKENQIKATFAKVLTYPEAYQRGRPELKEVKSALRLANGNQNLGSIAICGAGGYGKSYLTQEICDDESIQKAFAGGIYWLQFGLLNNSNENSGGVELSQAIDRMLVAQYSISERPPLVWDERDSDILKLVDILPSARLLLIADDLWTSKQSSWLSQVPANVSVLVTTRRQSVAKQASHAITIQHLTHDASYRLLTHGMTNITLDQKKRLQKLAKEFKGWPLLLGLANGVFKQREGDPKIRIDWSLDQFEQFLADDEIDAWDIPETGEEAIKKRQKFVGFCIEAGLRAIHSSNNPDLLRKMAVFSADADIPFSVTIDYWAKVENKRISQSRGEALLRHFADFSFFSSFNENTKSLRLHDEILRYFRVFEEIDQEHLLHRELLASMQKHCGRGWETLPLDHKYGWKQLLHHLERDNRLDEADDLRTDFHWLKAKLASVGVSELQRSFSLSVGRSDAQLVGRAVNLSISELSTRPESLAHQLFGRLSHEEDPRLIRLTRAAQSDSNFWPVPLKAHLPPIGLELLRLLSHRNSVNFATFDPSGQIIVTAAWDKTARLWNAQTGAQIGEALEGHSGPVNSAVFDPEGSKIVTASDDNTVRLWDAETGKQIGDPLRGHSRSVNSAVFDRSGSKIVTASNDETVRLWDAETGKQIGEPLKGHSGYVNSAVFDRSGSKIVTASNDETVRLWDVQTGKQIGEPFKGHSGFVNSAVFDRSGSKIVTASNDETIRLWDVETGKQVGEPLKGHSHSVNSAVFDRSGSKIVTTSDDRTVRLWDVETGKQIGEPLEGHSNQVKSATFDLRGSKVVTASSDQTARLWNVNVGELISKPREGHNFIVLSVDFDPAGSKVVSTSEDRTVRIWDAKTGTQIVGPLDAHLGEVNSAVFDPSGCKIVTASEDWTARIWNAKTGAQIGKSLEGHTYSVVSAVFDPTGSKILTASWDGTFRLWDTETCTQIGRSVKVDSFALISAIFDSRGRKVLTTAWNGIAKVWDTKAFGQNCEPLEIHCRNLRNAIFNRSGSKVLTVSNDGSICIWDSKTGKQIGRTLDRHNNFVNNAVFDPSDTKIVTASYDGTARLWDANTGMQIGEPFAHSGMVNNAAFDTNGKRFATTSFDATLRIWDVGTGKCLATVDFDAPPYCMAWHGDRLVVGLTSGLLCFFLTGSDI